MGVVCVWPQFWKTDLWDSSRTQSSLWTKRLLYYCRSFSSLRPNTIGKMHVMGFFLLLFCVTTVWKCVTAKTYVTALNKYWMITSYSVASFLPCSLKFLKTHQTTFLNLVLVSWWPCCSLFTALVKHNREVLMQKHSLADLKRLEHLGRSSLKKEWHLIVSHGSK